MRVELSKFVSEVQKILKPFTGVARQFNSFLERNPEFLKNVGHYLKNWPDYHKKDWAELASYGWFLNGDTPVAVEVALKQGKASVDRFMVAHLNHSWGNISDRIISSYPEREHVLSVAFKLHKDGNYIASVPLFLSQIDGICAQNLGAFLFSDHEHRLERIQQQIDVSGSSLTNAFLEVLNTKTQFGASISSRGKSKKDLAPNRNGILHGSRKHLDYGTEMNSLKAFSLLAFVVYCFEKTKVRPRSTQRQREGSSPVADEAAVDREMMTVSYQ
jgi:hypothetical protein